MKNADNTPSTLLSDYVQYFDGYTFNIDLEGKPLSIRPYLDKENQSKKGKCLVIAELTYDRDKYTFHLPVKKRVKSLKKMETTYLMFLIVRIYIDFKCAYTLRPDFLKSCHSAAWVNNNRTVLINLFERADKIDQAVDFHFGLLDENLTKIKSPSRLLEDNLINIDKESFDRANAFRLFFKNNVLSDNLIKEPSMIVISLGLDDNSNHVMSLGEPDQWFYPKKDWSKKGIKNLINQLQADLSL